MSAEPFKYRWRKPKARVGDTVEWVDGRGEVVDVNTHYDRSGKAWHAYRIFRSAYSRCAYVNDRDIRIVHAISDVESGVGVPK